ncbi:carbonic anhydrase family protein [Balneola sp. MJW-20]|uniref:carbonic anhydrase family protein n=1 Tax=Gracilimonas aurantiaca TaxID=3234185 RepID=UPI003465D926
MNISELNSKAQNAETQSSLSPADALQLLKEGNSRFVADKKLNRDLLGQVVSTTGGQYPFAAVLSCIDSRVPAEIVFDQGIGDIFSARVAGNIVNEDILGSLEYSCKVAGSKAIVVMGHSRCGAVSAACDDVKLGNITALLSNIRPAVESVASESNIEASSSDAEFVQNVSDRNVQNTIDAIRDKSDILREMHDNGEIDIVGAMYHVDSGKVTFF